MNETTDRKLDSIRKALWCLVVVAGISAAGVTAFFVIVAKEVVTRTRDADTSLVVVARTNILAGTTLTRELLAKKRLPDANLPKHHACPHTADLLVGARILSDTKRADPIDLEQTDLWRGEREPQSGSRGVINSPLPHHRTCGTASGGSEGFPVGTGHPD